MGILANENAIQTGGYNIANSLRFQSASSQYLSRTFGTPTNQDTWSMSFWIKLSSSAGGNIFGDFSSGGDRAALGINSSGQFYVDDYNSAAQRCLLNSTQVFRDYSSWYHFLIVFEVGNATTSDRVRLYVNNQRVTLSGTFYANTSSNNFNAAGRNHSIGNNITGSTYLDGYMTEVNFIDGQALTPSSFGETNTLTGQWVAKKYTGTYGTNGFYLPFSNGTSTTTLGTDSSGNGNNWTLTNFTRAAGVSDCWMYDVPSGNGSAGTQPNSNYCVWNNTAVAFPTYISNSNLMGSNLSTGNYPVFLGSIYVSSGKFYAEITSVGSAPTASVSMGISKLVYYASLTQPYAAANTAAPNCYWATSSTAAQIVGVALDMDAGTCQFYVNGVADTLVTGLTGAYTIAAIIGYYGGSQTVHINSGQRSFAYTPPSGFKALCTANLPASTIVKGNQYMDATTYSGNSSTQNIVNAAGFSPDLVWIKSRSGALVSYLSDTVRGAYRVLFSSLTNAEYDGTSFNDGVSAFNSNGFTLLNGSNVANYNQSGSTYVAWQWDAGSSTVTNTNGTISSQVRANPTAGVSVVTYTGTGANATVGHGLGVAPKMVIVKRRTGTFSWGVWHTSLTGTEYLLLDTTNAKQSDATAWNSTIPSSTVFSLGSSATVNGSTASHVAYCFAAIQGFSAFGSYTGNASTDGTFVYLGFRPKYIMIKNTSAVTDWIVYDTSRSPYNVVNTALNPNTSAADGITSAYNIDLVSNGFKCRSSNASLNSSATFIYAAFAENPFANANAR